MFVLRDIEGYSKVGEKLAEEEWVVTHHRSSFSQGKILQRPVSRFNVELSAERHLTYYVFRIPLP